MKAPYPIKRKDAERLLVAYQLVQLARSGNSIICEYYADHGGPCPGLSRLSDEELRGIYRPFIEGVDRLKGEPLLKAVAAFERSQLSSESKTTCQLMSEAGRLCDGLNRWTNETLAQDFEILRDRTVID